MFFPVQLAETRHIGIFFFGLAIPEPFWIRVPEGIGPTAEGVNDGLSMESQMQRPAYSNVVERCYRCVHEYIESLGWTCPVDSQVVHLFV